MRTLLVTIALVMLLIAPLAARSSIVQNPDDKNWQHLVTSDDGNDIFYIPKISYGKVREIWWFERDPLCKRIQSENSLILPRQQHDR